MKLRSPDGRLNKKMCLVQFCINETMNARTFIAMASKRKGNILLYPVGATTVCCAVCHAVITVPPPGTIVPPPDMAQLVCGGCHTLLMYIRGATTVQCSCCHTVNLALEANQVAHVNCGNCKMLLRYPYVARSVKCAVCSFVTLVGVSTISSLVNTLQCVTDSKMQASTSTTEQKFST
ncbi:hypothetical protein V8G54_014185 [Vigna mungo]|uniref:Zinc finger LSD1-type domain-containing protein n=1 Tax=Vigna mungo TaxID=3915 RepID=A0AAQ3NIQ9_VIGMU